MKNVMRNSIAGALLACAPLAQAEFSANVALTTDYVFRGISQTDSTGAIQGGFDYNHANGFYAGVWGSSVDDSVGSAGLEYDLYLGYGGDLGSTGLKYDVGVINYRYPGGDSAASSDASEVYFGLNYKMFSAKYSMGVGDLKDDYIEAGASFELNGGYSVGVNFGRTLKDAAGADEGSDWKLSLSKEFNGFGFELAYTDTNYKAATCTKTCDGRLVLTVSKSM